MSIAEIKSPWVKQQRLRWLIIAANLIMVFFLIHPSMADIPETVNGVYLPPQSCERTISEAIYYAELAHLNAVVLHVKDPRGWIYWQSKHPIAREIGATHCRYSVEGAVKRLNAEGIWTIAKIDIFEDSLLAKKHPEIRHQQSIPGIGLINAVKIIARVVTPYRFSDKGHYLSYSGLIKHEKISGGRSYGKKNPRYCRMMKYVYKSGIVAAIGGNNPINDYYEYLIREKGYPEYNARHKACRRLAVIS